MVGCERQWEAVGGCERQCGAVSGCAWQWEAVGGCVRVLQDVDRCDKVMEFTLSTLLQRIYPQLTSSFHQGFYLGLNDIYHTDYCLMNDCGLNIN